MVMDWSWLGEAFKILLGAAVGIAATVIYDRRFSRRPDLRFNFSAPMRFETGDIERVFQNLEVTNAGMETTTDVRINFSRPSFDISDYQVLYDGPHNLEKTDEQVALLIPSLSPGESVTLSFIFTPSKSNIGKIQDLFLSARSKESIAKPLVVAEPLKRTKSTGHDWRQVAVSIILGLVILVGTHVYLQQRNALPQLRKQPGVVKITTEIVQLTVLVPNPVFTETDAEIECYIDNLANNAFAGLLRIIPPLWADDLVFVERIGVGAKSRTLVKWKLKVPNNVQPGKYRFNTELIGESFDQPVSVRTTEIVEVRQ
jgi:hypothetical protein